MKRRPDQRPASPKISSMAPKLYALHYSGYRYNQEISGVVYSWGFSTLDAQIRVNAKDLPNTWCWTKSKIIREAK